MKLFSKIKDFKPPLLLSCSGAVIFATASMIIIATEVDNQLSKALVYFIYIGAAVFLTLAVWAIINFFSNYNLKNILSNKVHQHYFAGRLIDNYAYRTIVFGYLSLLFNSLLALSKAMAGVYFSSIWLCALAGYYFLLCITKFGILFTTRKINILKDEKEKSFKEWKTFRVCGHFIVLLTLALQGVVILIIKEGNTFSYNGVLIYVVAIYDFYCFIKSIIYMSKKRKKHTPSIIAIKCISFATSLVAILSLQTAMFASFGNNSMEIEKQQFMNTITGSVVCFFLICMGLFMILLANKKISKFAIINQN